MIGSILTVVAANVLTLALLAFILYRIAKKNEDRIEAAVKSVKERIDGVNEAIGNLEELSGKIVSFLDKLPKQ